jgi:hypothetical protein
MPVQEFVANCIRGSFTQDGTAGVARQQARQGKSREKNPDQDGQTG